MTTGLPVRESHAGQEALVRVIGRVLAGSSPLALGLLSRSRALLAADSEADAFYTAAINCLTDCPSTLYLARTRLLYGGWLRRRKRRVEARQELCAAYTLRSRGPASFHPYLKRMSSIEMR